MASLRELARTNERLRSLCEDLEEVCRALQIWSASNRPEATAREAEYRQILAELEDELYAELSAADRPINLEEG